MSHERYDLPSEPFTITMSITDRVKLILARVEILKLMADDYTWSCHVPDDVKKKLEESLKEIDELVGK